mgnify:CR=1 FL=1
MTAGDPSDSPLSGDRLGYTRERRLLETGDTTARRTLAARSDAHPEVLYYLAGDADAGVRSAVAANGGTPPQADMLLTGDTDDEVRMELARKIARLVPGLSQSENRQLRERTLEVLDALARDTLPRVRALLAEEVKHSNQIPRAVVQRLARDVEETVSCPILEYSPLLNDDDLREIIAAGITQTALIAIARRERLDADVSDDIAGTLEIPAVAALLANPDAQIREDTLDRIIDQAEDIEDLHKPLALRPTLSIRAMKRIAGFVASALVHGMLERNSLQAAAAEEILERVRARIRAESVEDSESQRLAEQAADYFRRGMLTDDFICDGIEANRRELLIQCLALMADMPDTAVRRILHSKSGRAVTALAWKAGLSMRTAFRLQTELALVSPGQLVPSKNGRDYPLEDDELVWQLSYFTD